LSRILLLLALIVGVLWWLRSRSSPGPRGPSEPPPRPGASAPVEPQLMLSCARCGLHLPDADALRDDQGRPFCTDAHRLAGPQ
jgi:uncharacterized protein